MQKEFDGIVAQVDSLQAIYISDREGAIVIKGFLTSLSNVLTDCCTLACSQMMPKKVNPKA